MKYDIEGGFRIHLLLLRPGVKPGAENLEDRSLLFQADSAEIAEDIWTFEVHDRERLKGLAKFRPLTTGSVMLTHEHQREYVYCEFKGMEVQRSVCGKPAVVKFQVRALKV